MSDTNSRFQNSDFGNTMSIPSLFRPLFLSPWAPWFCFGAPQVSFSAAYDQRSPTDPLLVGLLFVSVGVLFVPAVGLTPPTYPVSVALFGVLCFSRFPRCCQSSSARCVRQLLLRQSFIEPLFSPGIVAPVGIRPLISPLVTGSGIASVTGSRWSSRGRVSGGRRGPRTNTARPWLRHRRRNHCQADCERRDEEKLSHVSLLYLPPVGLPVTTYQFHNLRTSIIIQFVEFSFSIFGG